MPALPTETGGTENDTADAPAEEDRHRIPEGLREILAVLNSGVPLEETLDRIIYYAGRMLGTQSGAIFRLEAGMGLVVIQSARGLPVEYVANITVPIGHGAIGLSVAQHRPVVVHNLDSFLDSGGLGLDADRRALVRMLAGRYNSLLAVPLVLKEQVYGGLVLYYPEPRDFTSDELDLGAMLGDYVALAIENARLRERAEQAAVAAERTRIARDLHDSVTQTLFSAGLIAEILPDLWARSPEDGRRRLEELRRLTKGALAEMRMLLLELRPAALTEVHLGDLLRQLGEAVSGRSQIPVELEVHGQRSLPADVQVTLYRIGQEAMSNVAHHSKATSAAIVLDYHPNGLALVIKDNGHGFDPALISTEHLGIQIMHERARTIGADLRITSAPGEGTQVSVLWPGAEHSKEAS
jgi:signal transduction histidine kinase